MVISNDKHTCYCLVASMSLVFWGFQNSVQDLSDSGEEEGTPSQMGEPAPQNLTPHTQLALRYESKPSGCSLPQRLEISRWLLCAPPPPPQPPWHSSLLHRI